MLPGEEKAAAAVVDPAAIAAAGITAIALYLLGIACFKLFGLPGPVAMLFIAVVVKLTFGLSSVGGNLCSCTCQFDT